MRKGGEDVCLSVGIMGCSLPVEAGGLEASGLPPTSHHGFLPPLLELGNILWLVGITPISVHVLLELPLPLSFKNM